MINKKEFYEKVDEVLNFLITIDPIKKRAENAFILFDEGKIMLAIIDADKDGLEELTPYTEKVMPFMVDLGETYLKNYEQGDTEIKIYLRDYLKPKATKERITEILTEENLAFLIDRLDDSGFCIEILNSKYENEKELTPNAKELFKYFT